MAKCKRCDGRIDLLADPPYCDECRKALGFGGATGLATMHRAQYYHDQGFWRHASVGLRFPSTCPCCGQLATSKYGVGTAVTHGRTTETRWYEVPHCADCVSFRERRSSLKSRSGWLIAGIVIALIVGTSALFYPYGDPVGYRKVQVGLPVLAVSLVAAFVLWLIKTRRLFRATHRSCCTESPHPIAFVWADEFAGPWYSFKRRTTGQWYIRDEAYARAFVRLNGMTIKQVFVSEKTGEVWTSPADKEEKPTSPYLTGPVVKKERWDNSGDNSTFPSQTPESR